jgi:DNA-binding NtrC family response regulator
VPPDTCGRRIPLGRERSRRARVWTQYRGADGGAAKDRRVPMRVLLIDDDALVRQTLADSLAEESIEVDGLANAEDALVLLSAGQVPDVLVTDIDLGAGLSGLDLASIAHERHPAVEVVLISGTSGAPGQPSPGRHERFLRKPFAPATLAQAIRGAAAAAADRAAA